MNNFKNKIFFKQKSKRTKKKIMKESELITYATLASIIVCMFITIYLCTSIISIVFKYIDKFLKHKIKRHKTNQHFKQLPK